MPVPRPPRDAAGVAPPPEPSVALFRDAAVAVPPTTPPGVGVERGDAAFRGVLPVRGPPLSLETERLGLDEEDPELEEDGPDREPDPLSAPPDPAEDPPELDPPLDELEPAVVRGTACAARPAGAASASPRAVVSASRVSRVMALTPLAGKRPATE